MTTPRALSAFVLFLIPLALLGGRSQPVGTPTWVKLDRVMNLTSGMDSTPLHVAPCITQSNQVESNVAAGTSARHACYPDPERDFQLTRFGLVVVRTLDEDAEECEYVLETSDDGTVVSGNEIASSRIQVGDGLTGSNPDQTNCNDTLDAIGESCFLDLVITDAATLVKAGGWFTINVNDGDSAQTCTKTDGIHFHVWGYYP